MKQFFLTLPCNFIACFKGRMMVWHLAAILLTFVLVACGGDWAWFCFTRSPELRSCMFPAVVIGQLMPIVLPLYLLLIGTVVGNPALTRIAWAAGQAAFLGWFIASLYKAFTGRDHPPHAIAVDTSHAFHFGFLRGGIFWGWPSSHTTTAFAVSVALFALLPQKKWLGIAAIAYAFYIGFGVSMTIHWFSDFVAGAIIGTVIGVTVGKSFLPGQKEKIPGPGR
jgi:membrane-associated phospholipid phosphatase